MSRKTLALIFTLLILTIVLIVVAIYTQGTTTTPKEQEQRLTDISPTQDPDIAQTTLSLSPNPVTVPSGTTSATTVNVEINTNTNNVSAVQLEIQYDPAVLTNMRITPGDFFPSFNILPTKGVNTQDGTISFAIAHANIRESKSGTGTVAVLQFTPRATAGVTESTITLLESSLVTQLGQTQSVLKDVTNTRVVLPRMTQPIRTTTSSPSAQQ